jgi:hypothetical protein
MKIIHKDQPFFYISLENIFSKKEWDDVYEELILLKPEFKTPEHTGSASLPTKSLKKNKGIFLGEQLQEEKSKIILCINNILKEIKKNKWDRLVFKRIFDSVMWGGELINYYENDDYYMPHVDNGMFTLIIWIWDKNLNFEGGDLYFPEYDYLHKCKNNHGILFLSKEIHGATTFKTNEKDNGRYSIVSFSRIGENNDKKFRQPPTESSSLKYQ